MLSSIIELAASFLGIDKIVRAGLAMRHIILISIILATITPCFAGENYNLEINENIYFLELDKEKDVTLPDGTNLKLKLSLKEFLEYEGMYFSFLHRNSYNPTKRDLGNGVFQTTMSTATGTVIIVQEYTRLDPSSLVDLMIRAITKKDVASGYELKENDVSKKMGNIDLKGKEAITTYKDVKWTRFVYVYGAKDEGLIIMTIIKSDNVDLDIHMIRDFWRTLKIRL